MRNRMNDVSDQLGELRSRAARLRRARDIAREHGEQNAEAVATLELDDIDSQIAMANQVQQRMLSQMAGMNGSLRFGETIFDDPNTMAALETAAKSSAQFGSIYGHLMSAEQLADSMGGGRLMAATPATVPPDARYEAPYGVIAQLYRPTFLLDLIPTAPMVGLAFHYVSETGTTDNAAETPEGSIKPSDATLTYVENTLTAHTIAVYQKLARQTLSDLAWLSTNTTNRLLYEVNRRTEHQILLGDGTGENITGIFNTTGIGSIAFATGTPQADLILQGVTSVRLSNGQPNGIVVNPSDYQQMLELKATGSGERLDSEGAFTATPDTMWGIPLVQTALMPVGQALVGDFLRGTHLFVREGLTVRISDSDQDDFLKNQVTMLAETRVGFAVFQPAAMCQVHIA
jgi:HK97 family phage major capsid protein